MIIVIYNPVEIIRHLNYIRTCAEGNAVVTNLGVLGKRLHVLGNFMEEMNMPMPINAAPKRIAPKIFPVISAHDGAVKKLNTSA